MSWFEANGYLALSRGADAPLLVRVEPQSRTVTLMDEPATEPATLKLTLLETLALGVEDDELGELVRMLLTPELDSIRAAGEGRWSGRVRLARGDTQASPWASSSDTQE